jgi:ubiquinone/menaquinone biosynthesis C-methylase UbiE
MSPSELERSLESQIAPWLEHMRWRRDFEQWRNKRLWQENFQADALADVRRRGKLTPEMRVLDLGAGMGGFAVALAKEHPNLIALDYNFAYCEITRTRGRRYSLDLRMLVAAGEALPFASGSFARLTCWDVVEHVQDPARLFSEIASVLEPGGCAFVTVINRFGLVDPHYHLRFVNWMPRRLGEKYIAWRQREKQTPLRDRQKLGEMHYFTYPAVVRLAARHGLRVEDLSASRSRLRRLPRPLGDVLYVLWRSIGIGTMLLIFSK